MENTKRIEACQLPEETIQHIQSFLSGKEAARTSILSKPWYTAWLTRPNHDLDETDFPTPPGFAFPTSDNAFMKFAKKTMQRYVELNPKIRSFRLRLQMQGGESNELIRRALKLGATHLVIDLKKVRDDYCYLPLPPEVFESQTLFTLSLVGCNINVDYLLYYIFWPGIGSKLKVLCLKDLEIGEWIFRDLSSRFPCLKELTVDDCIGYEEIHIRSNSLELISFIDRRKMWLRLIFDVPRIKKFKFLTSYNVPSLCLKTTSTEWESDISIECRLETSILIDLREFLQKLSPSKIHLELRITCQVQECDQAGDVKGVFKPPIVEKLTILCSRSFSVQSRILEDLFWSCRPNLIVLYLEISSFITLCEANNDFTKLLCNTLIEEGNENRNISALHDLKEVNVEFFEEYCIGGWRSLHCKTLLEAYLGSLT